MIAGSATMYRIGIDVGGTFTDLVAIDPAGVTTLAKVTSTPDDPSLGVLDGLQLLADRLGLGRAALLGQTDRIVHGTTVATNALLEHKGARTGLLTTEGHRDVVEMREAAITALQREGVEAVAVCYLHAWRDPRHEHATRDALLRALPDVYVSLSS